MVDIGSNSTKALIAWLHEDLALRKIAEESYAVAFLIQKPSFKSILKCAIQKSRGFRKLFIRCSRKSLRCCDCATEAIRRAENKTEVIDRIENKFGFKPGFLRARRSFLHSKRRSIGSIASVKGFQHLIWVVVVWNL